MTRQWRDGARAIAALAITPRTGRHHQIRVHLRSIGCPILGDTVYGRGAATVLAEVPVPRLALHAAAIDLPHPDGARRVTASSPWPADLTALTTWLDASWAGEATTA